ncbi:unnamed protein product [Linum tenue]|uniref:Uncharacterized protein n=1 Tax=Linum tenue TaxID=586396 RepID=A0AAV0LD97_9ROSI|nr:unnamed protein product [Linum tenue]
MRPGGEAQRCWRTCSRGRWEEPMSPWRTSTGLSKEAQIPCPASMMLFPKTLRNVQSVDSVLDWL